MRRALQAAQAETVRPSLICARTVIGFGSPKAETFGVHGAPLGPDGVVKTKEELGYPVEPAFYVSDRVREHFLEAGKAGAEKERAWKEAYQQYEAAEPRAGPIADAGTQ